MKWMIAPLMAFLFNNANASNFLGFEICDTFDLKKEESRLSGEKYKIKLEKNIDSRYSTYWIEYFEVYKGGALSLRLAVLDGKLYKISLVDTMGGSSKIYLDEYFKRMKGKYGNPKFVRKDQNEFASDTWDVIYKYNINDKDVDVLVGASIWKSTASAYGFNFIGSGDTAEYVCKNLDKVYMEYKKKNEPSNKRADVRF